MTSITAAVSSHTNTLILTLGVFGYIIDCVLECASSKSVSVPGIISDEIVHESMGLFPNCGRTIPMRISLQDSRIVFSCLVYCLVAIISRFSTRCYKNGLRSTCNHIFIKLFHKKSFTGIFISIFIIWICALNLLLITMTIPNIMNPGPINELHVMYNNVQGFVNIRGKGTNPDQFRHKVSDFHEYIFYKKA